MAIKNTNLQTAKNAKSDEFYTQAEDVNKELKHYTHHFKDKVIYCNCDNPEWSEFWRYFHINFNRLGLRKLISTHYEEAKSTYKMEYCGGDDNDITAGTKTTLTGNGDFASDECLSILDEADIVVSNPPFSLFKSYIFHLFSKNKYFIILGNMNASTYNNVFPLIKNNQLWYGKTIHSGDREFKVPDDYPLRTTPHRTDKNGNKYVKINGVRWFTNLAYDMRPEPINLTKGYEPKSYPKYDNYDAINVDKTMDIPRDYDGLMGVPISFLDKYCSEQFEIIGYSAELAGPVIVEGKTKKRPQRFFLNGKRLYDRIVIRKK